MPLRLALNHTRLASSGGVEGYIWNLLRFLLERGHEVDFFAGKFLTRIEHPNLRSIRVRHLRSPRPARVASFALQSHRRIRREASRRSYDVIQGFSQTYYHDLYRDGSGCRQDYLDLYLDRFVRTGLRKLSSRLSPLDPIVRRIERARYVTRPQKLVIAISSLVRDQILRRYPVAPETVRVIYSGVDCERFHPRLRGSGREALDRLAAGGYEPGQPGRRYLAFVGNDYRRKGLDLLLEALAGIRRSPGTCSRPFTLVVAGSDPRAASYEAKARELGLGDRARFLGKRADIPEILAGADVLCLPTHFDAYANVSSEALASGTPVIASPSSGAAELIRPSHGWVLVRNDSEALGRALREFLSVEDLEPLRAAARAAALPLAWERHYAEIEGIYEDLAARRRGFRVERPDSSTRAG